MSDIIINVQNNEGKFNSLIAPSDMGLSLMEFLKGNDYDIMATCGGMALCATCHVQVIEGYEFLNPVTEDENAMLDTLPGITDLSRLSCQIKLTPQLKEISVKIMGDGL